MSHVRVVEAYKGNSKSSTYCKVLGGAAVLVFLFMFTRSYFTTSHVDSTIVESGTKVKNAFESAALVPGGKYIKAVTWNIAAVNNNPFEYWITNDDPSYNQLMKNVSNYIQNPGARDLQVKYIFTQPMFDELVKAMDQAGWTGVDKVKQYWHNDYKNRSIISQFLKDDTLGKKRLASMPDRVTNTINAADGTAIMRPTVINCYSGDLSSISVWWPQWLKFFFQQQISVKKGGLETQTKIFQMIPQISRAKYPAVTEEEEEISKPLQTLCMAIFDAILVHMLTAVGRTTWQPLRTDMCQKLNLKKNDRTVDILSHTYGEADVQFLQEVAGNFESFAKGKLISEIFDIHRAASMDTDRDQNSFILLRKGKYKDVTEVTEKVVAHYAEQNAGKKLPVVNGDLVVLTAVDKKDNTKYLLASFHGDASGLSTEAVVRAVHSYSVTPDVEDYIFLMGLDANTYSNAGPMQYGVTQFGQLYRSLGLNSCFGPIPNPNRLTINSEYTIITVPPRSKDVNEDKNPKDFIIFAQDQYDVVDVWRDNTGIGDFKSSILYPTIDFPSDHSIVSTVLHPKK